ncbi:MAG TPA: DUF1259 domain-containing protein [Roseiarcus sp.]|nr:DUF1259 domain-containing protein [Roseiarcus sp.]
MLRTIRLVLLVACGALTGVVFGADRDWSRVGDALGKAGSLQPGGVYRVALPRTDLKVAVDGVTLKAGFALGGWIAFEPMGSEAMMMGDLVLAESEINPVMSKLLVEGLQVTALHNHLLRAAPPIFYMHVAGKGDAEQLARAVRGALEQSKTPLGSAATPSAAGADLGIDSAAIDRAIGFKGRNNGGVYQYSLPRSDSVKQDGMKMPPAMGVAIGINFQPTGDGRAAVTGDFVALANEVNPLIKALRENGIEVTAIHNHMLDDEPRVFFIHFWANDDAVKLAKGLRAALDAAHVAPKG